MPSARGRRSTRSGASSGRTVEDSFLGRGVPGAERLPLRVFASSAPARRRPRRNASAPSSRGTVAAAAEPGRACAARLAVAGRALAQRLPRGQHGRRGSPPVSWRAAPHRDSLRRPRQRRRFQLLAACARAALARPAFPPIPTRPWPMPAFRWPIDPFTRRPVGYRLGRDRATAWLAGFRRRDDGGRAPYLDLMQARSPPGPISSIARSRCRRRSARRRNSGCAFRPVTCPHRACDLFACPSLAGQAARCLMTGTAHLWVEKSSVGRSGGCGFSRRP